VRAGHGHDLLALLEDGDHFGALDGGDPAVARLFQLRVVLVRGRSVDDELGVVDVFAGVALVDSDADAFELLGKRGEMEV
jgi:hypothetical protein